MGLVCGKESLLRTMIAMKFAENLRKGNQKKLKNWKLFIEKLRKGEMKAEQV